MSAVFHNVEVRVVRLSRTTDQLLVKQYLEKENEKCDSSLY